jgi:tetratricopeptide (TPR) repeat protein
MNGAKRIAIRTAIFLALGATGAQAAFAQAAAQGSPKQKSPANARVEKFANPAAALRNQAIDAMAKNDFATAVGLWQKYLADQPNDPYGHFELGYAFTALSRWDEAKTEYQKAVAIDPKLEPAQLNLGLVLLRSDPAAAIAPLRQAATLAPTHERPHLLLGLALERTGNLAGAAAEYRAAAKLNPKDFDARYEQARILLKMKQPVQAESAFREALAIQPASAEAMAGLSESLLAEGKTAEAMKELEAYVAARPKDETARLRLAGLLANAGNLDGALEQLSHVGTTGPNALGVYRLRGEILLARKDYAGAADALGKAAELDPQSAPVQAQLGQALVLEKQYAPAAQALKRAVTLDPTQEQAWRDLVAASYLNGEWQVTLDALDHLEQKANLPAVSWFIRASSEDHLGRLAPAIAAYQKFLALDHGQHGTDGELAKRRLPVLESLLRHQKKRKKK